MASEIIGFQSGCGFRQNTPVKDHVFVLKKLLITDRFSPMEE